jgi:[acyl-carrier-protein] S-malonyltransferase
MKANFIFPGQGSQYIGLGNKLFNKCDYGKKIVKLSNELLEYNIAKVASSTDGLVHKTKYTQPAIFIYSIIADFLIRDSGYIPTGYAGHSLGEYTALVSSGCLDFEDALKIVKERSEMMDFEGKIKPGKMCAVLNFDAIKLKEFKSSIEGDIVVANYNSNNQIILSGDKKTIEHFFLFAKQNRIKCIPLNVSGAFHSPLMNNVKIKLESIIKKYKFKDVQIPIYQNTNPEKKFNGIDIKNNLINQVNSPVYWVQTINQMLRNHPNTFLEIGPSNVLTKLNKNINKNINSLNFNTLL